MIGVMEDMLSGTTTVAQLQSLQQGLVSLGVLGLVGWIGPLVVLIFGLLPSTPGPNRFGEAPALF
jgi:uncharacterized membrane protein YhaH (DUF805 family)